MSPESVPSSANADVVAGQAAYSSSFLKFYDLLVLGFNNHFAWRCPTTVLVEHYNAHVSADHLDVGVGTGYFLDRCRFPRSDPRLVLMDLNSNSLSAASRRVARYRPETVLRNVLEPIDMEGEPFSSIGLNLLLHCVPGSLKEKAIAFDRLRVHLRPGGVIFGATVLSVGVERNRLARATMRLYTAKGIFHNDQDSLADLQAVLEERFVDVRTRVVGCVGVFSARNR
jgi:ubiquinone/menaquinone biosynthesis C-methylase UbiE